MTAEESNKYSTAKIKEWIDGYATALLDFGNYVDVDKAIDKAILIAKKRFSGPLDKKYYEQVAKELGRVI